MLGNLFIFVFDYCGFIFEIDVLVFRWRVLFWNVFVGNLRNIIMVCVRRILFSLNIYYNFYVEFVLLSRSV